MEKAQIIRGRTIFIIGLLCGVVLLGFGLWFDAKPQETEIITTEISGQGENGTVISGSNTSDKPNQLRTNDVVVYESSVISSPEPQSNAAILEWDQSDDDGEVLAIFRTHNGTEWSDWVESTSSDDRKDGTPEPHSALVIANEIHKIQYRLELFADEETNDSPEIDLGSLGIELVDTTRGPSPTKKPLAQRIFDFFGVFKKVSANSEDPVIFSRSDWGSPESNSSDRWTPQYRPLNRVLIHHTATTENGDSAAGIRAIWEYHANTLGWGDIGYNYIVDSAGNIFQGRYFDHHYARENTVDVVGGHALEHNWGSTGIAALGTYSSTQPSAAVINSIGTLAAFKMYRYDIHPGGWDGDLPVVVGHRDVLPTSCPGTALYSKLTDIRTATDTKYQGYRTRIIETDPLTIVERSMASGDFNNDGYADLAIGSPGEGVGSLASAGAVNVIYGSASGLDQSTQQHLYQAHSESGTGTLSGNAEAGDYVGSALATGDFNNDTYVDLAIGSPGEDVGSLTDAGAVNIIYGSSTGLDESSQQHLYQTNIVGGQLTGNAEVGDLTGAALATGDFNNDTYADLAIGSPGEDVGALNSAGAINVIFGAASGLDQSAQQHLYQAHSESGTGVLTDNSEAGDYTGAALTSGDFDNDSYSDLAYGVPGEDFGSENDAGAVGVIFGFASGLDQSEQQHLYQSHSESGTGVLSGNAETTDYVGATLANGDFDNDNYDDLAIGSPGEDVGSLTGAGAVNVIFGTASGLNSGDQQHLYQSHSESGTGILSGGAEQGDYVGSALATGDFNNDTYADLAIGSPGEDIDLTQDTGAINVIYGSGTGLDQTSQQLLYQLHTYSSTGLLSGVAELGDYVGTALVSGDFDNNNYVDLAIGSPGEDVGSLTDAGAVNVIFGSASGLDSGAQQHLYQSNSETGTGVLNGNAESNDFTGGGNQAKDFW